MGELMNRGNARFFIEGMESKGSRSRNLMKTGTVYFFQPRLYYDASVSYPINEQEKE